MTTKNETSNADTAEQACRTALQEAHQLRSGLLGQLGDQATRDIAAVQDQLDAVEVEIALEGRRLGHFVEARKLRDAARTDEGKAHQHEQTVAQLADAVTNAAQLGDQCKALLASITSLGVQLSTIESTRQSVTKALRSAANTSRLGAKNERTVADIVEQLHAVLDQLTMPIHVARALHEAGVGRRGVIIPTQFVEVHPVAGPDNNAAPSDPSDEVNTRLAKLAKLATQIEEWSTALTSKAAA